MNPGEGELSLLYPGEGESCLYPREGEDHQSLRDKVWKLYQGRGEENRAPGKIFFTEQRETKDASYRRHGDTRRFDTERKGQKTETVNDSNYEPIHEGMGR